MQDSAVAIFEGAKDIISPYGGKLVNLVVDAGGRRELIKYANKLSSLKLSLRSLCDIELLSVGAFSPLDRFMGQAILSWSAAVTS